MRNPLLLPTATPEQVAAFNRRVEDEERWIAAMISGGNVGQAIPPTRFEIDAEREVTRQWSIKVSEFTAMTKSQLRAAIIAMGGRVTGNYQPIHSASPKREYIQHALATWAGTVYTRHTGVIHEWVPVPDYDINR